MSAAIWLVYSREHNAWWRPTASGYTNHIEAAGRYTKTAAEAHCGTRDYHDKDNPPEVMSLAPEAGDIMDDLLDALKNLADDAMHHQDGDDRSMTLDGTINRAMDAIARAEGTGNDPRPEGN